MKKILNQLSLVVTHGGRFGRILCLLFALSVIGQSLSAASASWNYTTVTGTIGTTYDWIDCSSGTTIVSGNDSQATIAWPFDFDFFNDSYTTSNNLSVCTNGFIRLDGTATTAANTASNFSLTASSTNLGQIIAIGIEDNEVSNSGWVRATVTGTAPFRTFTIEFNNLTIRRNDARQANVQVQFYETSNKVVLLLGNHNVTRGGVDMGLHSGVNNFFHKWRDLGNSTANQWIEYTPRPVLVKATAGTAKTRYNTLREAFTAINNGTHRQSITIEIAGSITDNNTATLNASGSGSANYTTVNIYPVSITSNVILSGSVGDALIYLNGADNVTIDGRPGGIGEGSQLTITNTSTQNGAVTVLFNNGATNNTLRYTTLRGGGGNSGNATVHFGNANANTNNVVSYNTITNNGSRRTNAVYSNSTNNTSNVLSYNNIFDTWTPSGNAYAINLMNGAYGWTILGNSIYETTAFNPSGGNTYYGVYLSGSSSLVNTVSDNFFGGKSSATGGAAMEIGKSNLQSIMLIPFYLNVSGSAVTSIQGNYIRNIEVRSSSATPFMGYRIDGGAVNLGTVSSNAIGDTTGTSAIMVTSTATSATSYGILLQTSSPVSIHNSRIGSITLATDNNTKAHSFYGVYNNWTNIALDYQGNTVGSMGTPASINATSAATDNNQFVIGIYTQSTATATLQNNTVANLRNQSTRNNEGNFAAGIRLHATSTTTLHRNLVYGISSYGVGGSSFAAGIYTTMTSGEGSVYATNNIVSMGANLSNPQCAVYGVYNMSNSPETWYHNSIVMTTVRTGNTNIHTVAFYKGGWNSGVSLINNLFVNLGSGGTGNGRNVVLYTGRLDNTSSDYNLLYAPAPNGLIGLVNGTQYATMANWQGTGRDTHGVNEDPQLVDPTGNYPQAYAPTNDVFGTNLMAQVPTDYLGAERDQTPTPGAIESIQLLAVEVYKNGVHQASYTTLSEAFDRINDGTHTGDLVLKAVSTIKEQRPAVLQASGTGAANYTSILLYPTKTDVELYGAFNGPLITLNGAKNVTLDGRVQATGNIPDLKVFNTSTDANAVTLMLTGSASQNTFTHLNLMGGGGSASNGTITIGSTGNNNDNTFTRCTITHNGTRRAYAFYAEGGTSLRNSLIENSFYDTWSPTQASSQVYLGAGASAWTLQGNSFYETTAFRPTVGVQYSHLLIQNPSGQGFVVADNYFGGSAPQSGGSALNLGNTSVALRYVPLQLSTGNITRTSIQGNTIANIAFASSNAQPFIGMWLQTGGHGVGQERPNTIGAPIGTDNIQLQSAVIATSYAIFVETPDSVTLSSNRIGAITLNTTNQAHHFTAIHQSANAGYLEVLGNLIGSEQTAGSIVTTTINGGVQQNLVGIDVNGTGTTLISRNTVSGLRNNATQYSSYVFGIALRGTGTSYVSTNFVYNLVLMSNSVNNVLAGLYTNKGSNTLINNVVVLPVSGLSTMYFINGIRSEGTANDVIYHNTVLLRGNVSGSSSTYTSAYLKTGTATVTVRNNIFYNALSGGSGNCRHSAIGMNNNTGLTSNYNLLYAPNTNGVVGATIPDAYNASSYTLAGWRTASGQDGASVNSNPQFYAINGSTPTDFATTIVLGGMDLRNVVPTDFDGATRSANPTIGAWEYFAPVDVYSGETLLASYNTLKAAFDAINNGTHKGDLIVQLNRSTTETATAQLNASGTNGSSYQRVLIYPNFNNLSISASLSAPLITLNGADRVVLDGRVRATGTEASLRLVNTSTNNAAVTLYLNNGATQDTIRYCIIEGGGGSATNGTIHFGNTGANNNNLVEWCHITHNGARRVNAVYASGGTTLNNTLQYNRIYDTWLPSATSNAVYLGTGASAWSLIGNSLYETTSFQPSGNYSYAGIRVSNTNGTGFQLIGNYLGGRDSLCTGEALTLGVTGTLRSLTYFPIQLQLGTAVPTLVRDNVVRNVALRSAAAAPFSGLYLESGQFQLIDNTVGDTLGTGSITVTGTAPTVASHGIHLAGATFGHVSGNRIGSFTTTNSSTANAHDLYAINLATSGTLTLTGNRIGSETTPHSLQAASSATGQSQQVFGIYTTGTGSYLIDGNRLANLTNGTTETNQYSKLYAIYVTNGTTRVTNNIIHDLTSGGSASSSNYANTSMTGITSVNTAAPHYIVGNTVYNLTSLTTAQVEFYGIYLMPSTTQHDTLAYNFVCGFKMRSESNSCYLHGLSMHNANATSGGTLAVFNNIVFLGDSIARGHNLFGILKNTNKRINLYHNTVHLGGTVSDGSNAVSYALRERTEGALNPRDIRNNIFYNTRSGGGSNYALYIHQSDNLTIDYNDYGWSGTYFASINNGDLVTLQEWLDVMEGQDTRSRTLDPLFVNMGGTHPEDYKTGIGLDGVPGTGVTTDFGGTVRSTGSPTMGAWENMPVDLYSNGQLKASYFNLKAAFDAINAGQWTGTLTIKLKGSTQETATAQLNASGTGSANYSSVLIHPVRSEVVVRGNLDGDVIRLQGADNVTIDGRINASGSIIDLVLTNQSTGANATTLHLAESATNNTVRYTLLTGAGTGANSAIVRLGTASTGNGNDNNTFTNNRFTGISTTERPYNALLSQGSAGRGNSGNTVSNNLFVDTWRPTSTSNMLLLGAGTEAWTISGNNFMETSNFVPNGAHTYTAIQLNNPNGGGHTLSGNVVGGTLEQGLGSPMTVGTTSQAATFTAIYLNLGRDTVTSVQGNSVTNLQVSSSAASPFRAIHVADGLVHLGTLQGNMVGAVAGTSKIMVTSSNANATSAGLYLGGSGDIIAANNQLGAFTVTTSSSGNPHHLYVIHGSGSGHLTIFNNTIGSITTDRSIQTASASTNQPQRLEAIHYDGTGSATIEHNTISRLYNASTYNHTGNLVAGIYSTNSGEVRIQANYVEHLSQAATTINPSLYGIWIDNGASSVFNNVINLGVGQSGYNRLFGIYTEGRSGQTDSICHNTVYLSGAVGGTGSTAQTHAFYKNLNQGSTILLNNILFNARSGGSTASRHWAIYLPGTSSITAINGNDYYTTGTNGQLGRLNTTDCTTIANWRSATGKDQQSFSSSPQLINAGGNSALDFKIGGVLNGVASGVATDFGDSERDPLTPSIGAWEYVLCVEVWTNNMMRKAYPTLKAAFDDINNGVWTGYLTVKIRKSTYETATAQLNASGNGSANYSGLHLYPTSSDISVSGSLNGPLVHLYGADRVNIDGRVNGVGAFPGLSLINLSMSTGAATIRLSEAAQQDTIQYCLLRGAGQGTNTGIVHLGTTGSGTSGNSNNVVRYNRITGLSDTERPVNALYDEGSSSRANTANQVLYNEFYDLLPTGVSANIVYVGANTNATRIVGNSVYNTSILSVSTVSEYALIRINNSGGVGYELEGNYLGGQAPNATGTWVKIGQPTNFYGIYLNVGALSPTSLQGNTIRGFDISNAGAADFTAVHVAGGVVQMGTTAGNLIGAATGTGSITLTNSIWGGAFYGIRVQGSGAFEAANNLLGAITAANTNPAYATSLYGLYKVANAGHLTLTNNQFGTPSTPSSLQASSNAYNDDQMVYGIYSLGTGSNHLVGNVVANLHNRTIETTKASRLVGIYLAGGANTVQNNTVSHLTSGGSASGAEGTNAAIIGLLLQTSTAGQTLTGNTIRYIQNASTARLNMYGLYYAGPTTGSNTLTTNFVTRLLLPQAAPESMVYGVTLQQGTATVYNNIVAVGDSLSKGVTLYGFHSASASALTIYHNTVYVGGDVTAATSTTYAFRIATNGTHNVRNNIFANMRSGGGKHYAIVLGSTTGLTINYNAYWANGVNGVLGFLSSDRSTLTAWKTATNQDANSLFLHPLFLEPGSTDPLNYTPTASMIAYHGLVTVDFTGTLRSVPPTMGALELSGYFWTGSLDSDWTKADNWAPQDVPTNATRVNIPHRINQPIIYNGVQAQAGSLYIYSGAILTIDAGASLTVDGAVRNNAGVGGLVIHSSASGTGSLIAHQDSILATVRRYISGTMAADSAAWHFLSTPVTNQPIHGSVWTPAGPYGDGTAYDLYVWDEPSASWIYNLNDTTTQYTRWPDAHPSSTFVPGRGYLYSLYAATATPAFTGYLNNDSVAYTLTVAGTTGNLGGFNLVGNPYPSSLDWKTTAGIDRSLLETTAGGYDLWMWSSLYNNYGVYNSSEPTDEGTLNASRYISPMQGFFVKAATPGKLLFTNAARTHQDAGHWLRAARMGTPGAVRVLVSSCDGHGGDEVKLSFGYASDDKGTPKLFSHVTTAPSLYLPLKGRSYAIRRLSTTEHNGKTPLAFQAGVRGTYTLQLTFDPVLTSTVILVDKQTGTFHDFRLGDTYAFTASPGDPTGRFVLHYGMVQPDDDPRLADVYVSEQYVVVDLNQLRDEYSVCVYDLNGRLLTEHRLFGGEQLRFKLGQRGVYLVVLRSKTGIYTAKVAF